MWGLLTSTVTIKRRSAFLVESAVAAQTLTVARQPVRESIVEATVSGGTDGSGSLFVTGLSAGVTQTEELVYTAPGVQQTTRLYSSIVGMTTTGFTDEASIPSISARAIGRDGSAQHTEYDLVTGYPAAVDDRPQRWMAHPGGGSYQDAPASIIIPWCEVFEPREGDIAVDDQGRSWFVTGPPPRGGGQQPEFWKLQVKRHET